MRTSPGFRLSGARRGADPSDSSRTTAPTFVCTHPSIVYYLSNTPMEVPMIRPVHLPILFALAAIPVAACSYARGGGDDQDGVAASGTGGTRTYAVSGFDTVGLGGSGDVEVRVGPAFSVTATGAPATLDKIRVVQSGTSLDLGWKRGTRWSGGDGKVRYVVTMPRIAGASIGGSGTVVVDRVEGEAFE
ncbi:MAG: hypothetical protein EOO66_10980, partial [Methylobacterium sp.]